MSLLHETAIFLGAAVVSVPLFKKLGLGSVLGYLAAGIVIGPFVLGLVSDADNVLHFAEFGVVLLLFIIGLELEPKRLWTLRHGVFGVGGAQVGITTVAFFAAGLALGLPWPAALVAGFGLSLSSTAFVLQLLAEKGELHQVHGRTAFGILLFQDLAVIPFLAIVPLLAPHDEGAVADAPAWLSALKIAGVLLAVFVAGRFVLRPVFRLVAGLKSQELFTATALLVVVGTALLMETVGLSMALGAFLAGVLLADSEYRHEMEADIEPFKGLLLGLFFIAVGMTVNLSVVVDQPLAVAGLVLGLVAVKAVILYGVARAVKQENAPALKLAAVTSQGGEFAFVLFSLAAADGVLPAATSDLLVAVVSVSMAVTPVLVVAYERLLAGRLTRVAPPPMDDTQKDEAPVLIAGFGRVGQVVGRVLRSRRIPFTALDKSAQHVDFMSKFGNRLYYGDAARLDLLRAAKAESASIFVLAIDDVEESMKVLHVVKEHFPHLKVYARARNRQHVYRLMEAGVERIMRESFASSLELSGCVLEGMGLPPARVETTLERFRTFDESLIDRTYQHHKDIGKLQALAREAMVELEELFEKDAA